MFEMFLQLVWGIDFVALLWSHFSTSQYQYVLYFHFFTQLYNNYYLIILNKIYGFEDIILYYVFFWNTLRKKTSSTNYCVAISN